jgi:hypothetical protein
MKHSANVKIHFWQWIMLMCMSITSNAAAVGSGGGADKANVFIQSLRPEQKTLAVLPFYGLAPHEWTFYPASLAFPNGVAVKDLDSLQKNLLYDFIKVYLSQDGYDRTRAIMDLENVLHVLNPDNPHRIPENYFMAIYGTPHADSTWGWSFQGHHVVLNFTLVKDKIAYTPFFFGSNPAEIKEGPSKGYRAISAEEDIAYSLINSLSADQLKKAVFQEVPFMEIVTFVATQVSPLPEVGIPASEMSGVQKNLLHLLLGAYLSAMPEDIAAARLNRIKTEDGDMIYFGWAGSVKKGEPYYYRIQGKTFLVEFDKTQNNANHIHMVWRDFGDDFGRNLLLEHYQHDHQH